MRSKSSGLSPRPPPPSDLAQPHPARLKAHAPPYSHRSEERAAGYKKNSQKLDEQIRLLIARSTNLTKRLPLRTLDQDYRTAHCQERLG